MTNLLRLTVLVAVGASAIARAGDGNFDLTFGTLGVVDTGAPAVNIVGLALQGDRIVVSGRSFTNDPLLVRLEADGAPDPTFGVAGTAVLPTVGTATALLAQPDGRILAAGSDFTDALVARLDADGNPDPSFGTNGVVTTTYSGQDGYNDLALDPADKVLALGTAGNPVRKAVVARYLLADGSLDPAFWAGGSRLLSVGEQTFGGGVVRQPDGKMVVVGSFSNSGPVLLLAGFVMRLDDAGSVDGAFATNGVATVDFASTSDTAEDVALQPDGRIVIGGTSGRKMLVARYTADGMLDPTFAGIGYVTVAVGGLDSGRKVLLQADGKIVLVGYTFAAIGHPETGRWVVLRFLPDGTPDPTFGASGRVAFAPPPTPGVATAGALQSTGKIVVAGITGSASSGPISVVRLGGDCGDGVVAGSEQCDDGNAVGGDCCDLACQYEPAAQPCTSSTLCLAHVCDGAGHCGVPSPATGCIGSIDPGRSRLSLRDAASSNGDRLTWRFRAGDETTPDQVGSPDDVTDYALCGYGPDGGGGPPLLFELNAPAGGACPGRPCWLRRGARGFSYRDADRTPTGLDAMQLRGGAAGRVSMVVKGAGAHLSLPALPLSLPVRVQLRAGNGSCWETTFSPAGAVRNDAAQFRGKDG